MNINLLPKSAKAAKKIGSRFYFTRNSCKYGHISKRLTSTRACVECNSNLYKNNREQFIAKSKDCYEKLKKDNPNFQKERYAATRKSQKSYCEKNKDKRNDYTKQWYKDNNVHCLEYAKNYSSNIDPEKKRKQGRDNYKRNKPTFIANVANRRSSILKRTPLWLSNTDKETIKNIYSMAAKISEETGIKHHVDHKVPLQGETVCGLHVPWNLQIITATENISKSNKLLLEYS